MSRELVLTFGTPGKDELKITVSKPGQVEAETIKAAMEEVIASGAFGEKATVDKIVGAQFVVKQAEDVDLA